MSKLNLATLCILLNGTTPDKFFKYKDDGKISSEEKVFECSWCKKEYKAIFDNKYCPDCSRTKMKRRS
jgi:Zn finger protein HypA/HybF involved in hydrogenase expression